VIKWVRESEKLTLYEPRHTPTNIPVIGLGLTVPCNISGEVIVVNDWDGLDSLGRQGLLNGSIVLYNYKWNGYHKSVQYRVNGANRAKEYGALGVLIRSVASHSIESPHTGM